MSPLTWFEIGLVAALVGFPGATLAVALWMRVRNRSTADRSEDIDLTPPERNVPGSDDPGR